MIQPSTSEVGPATILVDVQLQKTAAEEHAASLQELRQLVEILGWDIVGTLTHKLQCPTAASLIGPGKLNELSELLKAPRMAESVVFDHELTPTQVTNIREATGVEGYDRPAIILETFHRHARTKEAQLQVEFRFASRSPTPVPPVANICAGPQWRAQNLFETLPSRRDTCIALPQRYIKSKGLEQQLESLRPYPQRGGMQNNES